MASTLAKSSRSPSIREIARIAKVAPSTVSRAFSMDEKDSPISAATRKKINAVCQKLNYYPNVHAQRIFSGRSNAIALVVPPWVGAIPDSSGFSDPNLARTLAGLAQAASNNHQELVFLAADDQFIETKKYLHILRGRQVDGLVVWGARPQDSAFITEVAQEGWPIVLANSFADISGVLNVRAANRQGSAVLARRLIELGHQHIGYITGPSTSSVAVARQEGFQAVCRECNIELDIKEGTFSFESGQVVAKEFLSLYRPPTAIAAVSDLVALGAIDAAQQRGLRVPEDLSVTGADDVFPYYKPRLTTFRAPMEEIGRQALGMLLENITDKDDVAEAGSKESVARASQEQVGRASQKLVGRASRPSFLAHEENSSLRFEECPEPLDENQEDALSGFHDETACVVPVEMVEGQTAGKKNG